MCTSTLFIDRYADGEEVVQKEEWACCSYGPRARPWECGQHYEDEIVRLVRNVPESIASGRSSESSSRRPPSSGAPSIIANSERSTRTRRRSSRRESRPMAGLFLDAFVGERRRSTRRSDYVRSQTITIDDRVPREYPATPSPTYRSSYESHRFSASPMSAPSPMTPRFSESWEANIVDASPFNRGRRGTPIIHDERQRRSDSTEVHADRSTAPTRARSPEPEYRDVREREERLAAQEERHRRRREQNLREAELARDIEEGRARRQRRQEQAHDAEIAARRPIPVVQQNSPPRPHGILRNRSRRRSRTDNIIEELNMSERGEQVLREAIAAKDREKREAEREAEMRRLGRRFERVVYVGEEYDRFGRRRYD